MLTGVSSRPFSPIGSQPCNSVGARLRTGPGVSPYAGRSRGGEGGRATRGASNHRVKRPRISPAGAAVAGETLGDRRASLDRWLQRIGGGDMWTRRTGCRRGSSKSGVVQRGGRSETQAVAVSTNPDAALVALMYACRCRLQLQARHRLAPIPPRDGTRSKDSPTPPPLACLACSYSSAIVLIFGPYAVTSTQSSLRTSLIASPLLR